MQFNLAALVNSYFNVDISGDKKDPLAWRLRYSELDGIDIKEWPSEAVRYAIEDSIWAYKLYAEQLKTPLDISNSVAADFYLNKMGLAGTNIDRERVLLLESELKGAVKEHLEVLLDAGIITKNKKGVSKRNMIKLKAMLIEALPDTIRKTAKGSISTSNEDMEQYLLDLPPDSPLRPILISYVESMRVEKVLTAFIFRLKQAEPLIRTQYKAVVSSGRTSSSTSTNFPSVNIQQMPREVKGTTWDIRNCFVPRPGYKICSIDYAGLELSSTAHQLMTLTGQGDMLSTINSGDKPVDMHSMLAYKLWNMKEKEKIDYQTFLARKKEKSYKAYRQMAKPINLGFPGGIGYDTMRGLLAKEGVYPKLVVLDSSKFENDLTLKRAISRGQGYPVRIRRVAFDKFELVYDELVSFKDQLFSLYPDLEHFLKEGHKKFMTGEKKMMKNEFGEWEEEDMYSFQVGDFKRDWCQYTQLCNGALMQSPAAIGAKRAVIRFMREFGNQEVVKPMAFIHDEIDFEIKICPQMYRIIEDISEIMIEEMQTVLTSVRIAVEAEVFDYWAKAGGSWSKQFWKNPNNKLLLS